METEKQLLRVGEVAKMLGLGVSSIWRLSQKSQLPSPVRIGGATRWRRVDIDALIAGEAT